MEGMGREPHDVRCHSPMQVMRAYLHTFRESLSIARIWFFNDAGLFFFCLGRPAAFCF